MQKLVFRKKEKIIWSNARIEHTFYKNTHYVDRRYCGIPPLQVPMNIFVGGVNCLNMQNCDFGFFFRRNILEKLCHWFQHNQVIFYKKDFYAKPKFWINAINIHINWINIVLIGWFTKKRCEKSVCYTFAKFRYTEICMCSDLMPLQIALYKQIKIPEMYFPYSDVISWWTEHIKENHRIWRKKFYHKKQKRKAAWYGRCFRCWLIFLSSFLMHKRKESSKVLPWAFIIRKWTCLPFISFIWEMQISKYSIFCSDFTIIHFNATYKVIKSAITNISLILKCVLTFTYKCCKQFWSRWRMKQVWLITYIIILKELMLRADLMHTLI